MKENQGYCTCCKTIQTIFYRGCRDTLSKDGETYPICGSLCEYDNGASVVLITQADLDADKRGDLHDFSEEQINEAFHADIRARQSPLTRSLVSHAAAV